MSLRNLLIATCALLTGGCTLFDTKTKVVLASDPPGARIRIDGKDSGFVTPCVLELDPREDTLVALELGGYGTARRRLLADSETHVILWSEMYLKSETWHAPFWLNARDLFVPIKADKRLSPSRVFVRLERTADQ